MIQTKSLLFSYWWRMGQNRREKNGATEPISDLGGHEIWISCSIQLLPRHCITLLIRYTAGTSNYFALLIFSSSFLLLHLLRSFVRSPPFWISEGNWTLHIFFFRSQKSKMDNTVFETRIQLIEWKRKLRDIFCWIYIPVK